MAAVNLINSRQTGPIPVPTTKGNKMLTEFRYRGRETVGLLMLIDGEYWFRILGWFVAGVFQRAYGKGSGLANPSETEQARTLDRRAVNIEETYWIGEMFEVKVEPRKIKED